ncbi:MAG: DUF1573 domain-containing protein [Chitinophagaceae bacterium]|jgi:hypothetical protein|nr:DUF1573 domain-containing protein [Chitinophagaceae bacterium]OQY94767.1 MAG: hypothetical protein B6D37_07890 [Sphingobacteriales bacterium UTBCD1]
MKKVLLPVIALFFSVSLMAQAKADDVIKVNVEKHDFGKLKQGVPVDYFFEIKNISNKPVVIQNSWASCGCTTPDKITEPIAPGATAKLKVQYSAAAIAPFTKDVYIQVAGIEKPKTVQITGEVLSAEAYDTWVKSKDKSKDNKSNN